MLNFNVPPLESIFKIKNHLYDLRLPSPRLVLLLQRWECASCSPFNYWQAERDAKRIIQYMHQSEREKSKGYHPPTVSRRIYTENLIPFLPNFFLRHSRRFNNISVLPQSEYDHVRQGTFIFSLPLLIAVCVGHTLSLFFDKRDDGNWIASHRESGKKWIMSFLCCKLFFAAEWLPMATANGN